MAKSIFELRESKSKASDALRAYAKKTNGTETREIQTIAGKLDNFANTGNPGVVRDAAKVLKQMDTKSQAQVMSILNKLDPSMGKSLAFKVAGMKEEVELDEAINEARADYKRSRTGQYNTKVTVCYISPITRMRACDDLWFKSKLDALGFKDDVRGFPKGAEVEAIKVMKESVELDETFDLAEAPEDNEPASPDEKSMAMDQAKFIKYVGDEIMEYLNKNKEFPEWMQNKLSGLHEKAKGFHATMAGKYNESVEEAWETDKGIEQKRKVSHDDTSESTKAYGKSQERMRDDKKKAAISSKDKATLGKIAAMLAKEKK
jgi:hypothetical protein